jgi:uncharacterized phiE125 gp8 family phage protein
MHYGLTLEPVQSPVTPQEFASWLRLDDATDPNLQFILNAATEKSIAYTGRVFIEQTITVQYDGYPGKGSSTLGLDALRPVPFEWIDLPYPRLISVESVVTEDEDGTQTVIDPNDYRVDTRSEPGRLNFKNSFPILNTDQFLIVEYKAGYGEPGDVPYGIKLAIMKIGAYMYEHRGDCDPAAQPDLFKDLNPYRVMNRL